MADEPSTKPGITGIRIVNGSTTFHVHGEQAGDEGVYLGAGQVHGLWDAPVRTTYKSGAFQVGSTYRSTKYLHRDLDLGFIVKDTDSAYEFNDSAFRAMFVYEPDEWDTNVSPTTIEIETELSGTRKLDVLMYEQPEFVPDTDPMMQQFGNIILKLRAPNPNWYEDTAMNNVSTNSPGTITVYNTTDIKMWHKWVLTPGVWTLPDVSWEGPPGARAPGGADANRYLDEIRVTADNGGAVIDTDRNALMFRDRYDTNIQAQMGGLKIFMYPIPPYTPPTDLPVDFDGSGSGMAQVRMPLNWSRPWGLEKFTLDS